LILQDPPTASLENKNSPYLIQSGDVLNIRVSSADPQSVAIFNKSTSGPSPSTVTEASIYLNGYIVDDSGAINMPVIGNIAVKGKDITGIQKVLEEKMIPYFKHLSVDVKLMNYRVTILGEITTPGTFTIFNKKTNILQLIGLAGGITDMGNKRKIKVIRAVSDSTQTATLNLTNPDFINSEYYNLMPNDIVYIEPLKAKALRVNSSGIQILLGTLTFVVVVLNFLSK
jgi:polysaccharide export outer membrane protein